MDRHARRLDAARRAVADAGADALVCGPGRTLRYLTGVDESPSERLFLLFVSTSRDPAFVVPELAVEGLDSAPVDDVRTWGDDAGPDAALDGLLDDIDPDSLLVGDRLWATVLLDLQSRLPAATFDPAGPVVASLRRRKDGAERDALRRAAEAADAAMRDVRELDAVGRTEADLASYVTDRLAAHGGEGVAFDPIVAAGPNGADPHHAGGDREIRPGDPVVLDFGTRVEGYVSDQTRTVVFDGDPPEGFERVHDVVREAQAAGIEAVEPGATTDDVDAAARAVVEDAGYGEAFVHRTGHGVGLDVHEEPYVVAGDGTRLEPGMAFSVEPGVYLPGRFGVRIEDVVLVTEDGCERLNRTDCGWRG
jgi:Xaa-Pro aminopeptidase